MTNLKLPVNDWRDLIDQGWTMVKGDFLATTEYSMIMVDAEMLMYETYRRLGT